MRECALWVLVEIAEPAMAWGRVAIEIVLLYVLAPVPLVPGQSESALLQHPVAAVPQGERKAQPLLFVADPAQAIFAPAIGARARLLVGERAPCLPVVAIVLADCSPCALSEIGSP